MNFLANAQIIIPEISGLPMTVFHGQDDAFEQFEKAACFLSGFQPLYTTEGLRSFFEQQEKNRIYEITDALDTRAILITLKDQPVILGPYITIPWQDTVAKILLADRGIQADKYTPYKIYRCRLPLIAHETAKKIAFLILRNMIENPDLEPILLDKTMHRINERLSRPQGLHSDIEQVNKLYSNEIQMMEAIQQGNATKVFQLFNGDFSLIHSVSFLTNSLNDKIAGVYAFRVLIRHAALRGGLTPVFVDALSQEYAQKMHRATTESQLLDLLHQYIIDFCQAVRECQSKDYSPYVRRAVQYIDLNLSKQISVMELADLSHITQQHFTQLFKSETGKTVKQYVTSLRCERAAELLRSSDLPIQDISQYVGYSDTNYFSRVFKHLMRMTPQDYRKQKEIYQTISTSQ